MIILLTEAVDLYLFPGIWCQIYTFELEHFKNFSTPDDAQN